MRHCTNLLLISKSKESRRAYDLAWTLIPTSPFAQEQALLDLPHPLPWGAENGSPALSMAHWGTRRQSCGPEPKEQPRDAGAPKLKQDLNSDRSFPLPSTLLLQSFFPDTSSGHGRKSIDFGSLSLPPSFLSYHPPRSAIGLDRMSPRPVPTAPPTYSRLQRGCE